MEFKLKVTQDNEHYTCIAGKEGQYHEVSIFRS